MLSGFGGFLFCFIYFVRDCGKLCVILLCIIALYKVKLCITLENNKVGQSCVLFCSTPVCLSIDNITHFLLLQSILFHALMGIKFSSVCYFTQNFC